LKAIFATKTCKEWLAFGDEHNTAIAPVNTPKTIADDPQFQDRLPWLPQDVLGTDQVPSPIKFIGESHPVPTKAPTNGEHTDEVLRTVLGYTDEAIANIRSTGGVL
jgi:crotonobetainyl-CoA:carnitine CoA-transferase CaiB-like acyl-CoA transferase